MRYLLDTDMASYLIRGDRVVEAKTLAHAAEWAISALTVQELRQGALLARGNRPLELMVEAFIEDARVLAFDEKAARFAADIRVELHSKGKSIGLIDEMLAGHAKSIGAVLVTNNSRHFGRIDGLQTDNWSK